MDHKQIVLRLRDLVPAAKKAKYAVSLAAVRADLEAQNVGSMWVYVTPQSASFSPSPWGSGEVGQQAVVRFTVFVAVKNVRDTVGDAAADQLTTVLRPIRKALHGWSPEGANTPIELSSGRIAGFSDFVTLWQEDFVTGYSETTEES